MAIKVSLLLVALGMAAMASALKNGIGKCPADRATSFDIEAEKLTRFLLIKSDEGLPKTVAEMTPFCADGRALLVTTRGIIEDCLNDQLVKNTIKQTLPKIEKILDKVCKEDKDKQFGVDFIKNCGLVIKTEMLPIAENLVDLAARAAEEKDANVRLSVLCNAFEDTKKQTDPLLKSKCSEADATFAIKSREDLSKDFLAIGCTTKNPKLKKIDAAAVDPPTSILTSVMRIASLGLSGGKPAVAGVSLG